MELRILGPLEVETGGGPVDLGTPKQRAILAMLAVQPGRVVSVQRIVDELWSDEPPERALASLQAYVSRLRRAIEPGRSSRDRSAVLVSRAPGYLLAVEESAVDAARFTAAVESFSADDDPGVLTAALSLWRGDPLPELGDTPLAQAERARLTELRWSAVERRSDALLARGRPAEVVYASEAALAEAPYRERLWWQLMLALYRSDRQAEALAAFARARALLVDDLGIDPSPALLRLESDILRQSPALAHTPDLPRDVPSGPVPSRPAVTGPADDELIGRDDELAAIDRVLEARSGLLLVSGSPGIGKSALLAELAARAARQGFVVGAGTGVDAAQPPVFLPWAQVLRGLASTAPAGALAAAFAPHGNLPAVLDPALAELVPLPAAERLADADLARSRLLQGIADGVRRLARDHPVLVVIDDAHWLDAPSTTLLALCSRALAGTSVVLAAGYRAAELAPAAAFTQALGELGAQGHAVHLPLEGLSPAGIEALCARIAARAVAPATAAVIADRTGGNPFFARELLHVLIAEHALDPALAGDHLPARVQEVLRRRLSRLPIQVGAVVAVAAVLGREFDVAVLRDLTQLDELDLFDTLDTAVVAGVLSPAEDPARLRFAHDLMRQSAYLVQGPLRRARLHARAAHAIQAASGSATEAAGHLRLAAPLVSPLDLAPALAAAATEAYDRTAHAEAVQLLQEAAAVLSSTPQSPQRDELELEVRVRLAFILQATEGYLAEAVADQYARMEPILRRTVTPAALWGYASFHLSAGNHDRLQAIQGEAPWIRITADTHEGMAALAAGDLPTAMRLLRRALDRLPDADLPISPVIDWDPVTGILGPAAAAASLLGDRLAAEAYLETARQRPANTFQRMYVSHYAASVAADYLDTDAMLRHARRTLTLAELGGHPEYRAMADITIGFATADLPLLRSGEAELGPALWRYPRLLPLRPTLLWQLDRPAEAAALGRERLAVPLDGLNRFAEPDLRRVLGLATGDRAELETALRLATELRHAPATDRARAALDL